MLTKLPSPGTDRRLVAGEGQGVRAVGGFLSSIDSKRCRIPRPRATCANQMGSLWVVTLRCEAENLMQLLGDVALPLCARMKVVALAAFYGREDVMSTWRVKLLYDGACPFCRREVQWLKRRDRGGNLAIEDISDPAFDPGQYGLTREEVMGVLHGVLPDGRVVRGLEAMRQAYQAIGLGWLVVPTGWPLVGRVCDHVYGAFARNRVRLGRLLSRPHGSCACVVADGPPGWRRMAVTRKSVSRGWIQDADRQPFLPRKKMT